MSVRTGGTQPTFGGCRKVTVQLGLPNRYAVRPEFLKKETTFRRFGFDLRESNRLPLDRTLPDYRSEQCKAIE